jgi:hypothetical protein
MKTPLRRAHLYLAENRPAIIAASHFNSSGVYFEQDGPLVCELAKDGPLAGFLRTALSQFSFRDVNLRDHKKTDWPSYKASQCRSVREFEREYLLIGVSAVNEAELFYDACCQPHGEDDVKLHVTFNRSASADEIDRQLNKLFNACLRWDASGF